ncbi:MAG: arylsulfatase [Phycisphaerae bacterium]|nr:arylsulfatase [Phycisphaerae bacterium]
MLEDVKNSKMKGCSRRTFVKSVGAAVFSAAVCSGISGCNEAEKVFGSEPVGKRPNIILFLTDDQGYGDLGSHNNPAIKTPNIDKFAKESVELTNFYVNPVCAPTRAALLTGRDYYRTGVTDTYLGRAMMRSGEVTLAEVLKSGGYNTSIFGKWHLGDNYPMRPIDQGFDESVVHNGGGIGQPSDPPGNSYFDPILQHNGKAKRYNGYCMDVYTEEAIKFVEENKNNPFFLYLATNTPHSPLQINDKYADPYREMGLSEKTSRLYGMVANIDEDFGRLLAKIRELGIEDNTVVIFMSDNGPCPSSIEKDRFMDGLRGQKATVYENGIKVPFFVRWPGRFTAGQKIDRIASGIDIMPTLLSICNFDKPKSVSFDGVDLTSLLDGTCKSWPDRTLYFQWHRGDVPELYRSFAVRNQRYKLVQAQGWTGEGDSKQFKYELFDISQDPGEKNDLAGKYLQIVADMKQKYIEWLKDVSKRCGEVSDIYIGSSHENPSILTRQDWRGADGWSDSDVGHWNVRVVNAGRYSFEVEFSQPLKSPGKVYLWAGDKKLSSLIKAGTKNVDFGPVKLTKGKCKIRAWMEAQDNKFGAMYVTVKGL